MPENFQVPAALNEVYWFSFNNSVCRHKESITEPFTYNIWQLVYQSFRWNAFCNSTTLITSNLESFISLLFKNAFQYAWANWYTNVTKITLFFATFPAALLVKSYTLLTSSSIKQRRFSQWLLQAEISLVSSMNKHQRRWLVLLQQPQQLHIWTELLKKWGGYVQIWGRIVNFLLKAPNFQEWQN